MQVLLPYLTLTQFLVVFTLVFSLFNYNKKSNNYLTTLIIVCISFITEVGALFLVYNGNGVGLLYTISVFFHHGIWLYILIKNTRVKKIKKLLIPIFIVFCVFNLMFFEGSKSFNFYSFIFGALLYLAFFIYDSFYELKLENFTFFQSNKFILLSSPVIFFLGLSFILGFRNYSLSTYKIGGIILYDIIGDFINIVYYSLLCIFIYKEKKLYYAP